MKRTVTFDSHMPTTKKSKQRKTFRKDMPTVSAIQKIVNQAITRRSETKCKTAIKNEDSVNSIGFAQIERVQVPAQGAQVNERIGNRVNGVGIGSSFLFHNNSTSENVWVRALLLEIFDGQLTDTEVVATLFEGTNDNLTAEAGGLADLIRKVDREQFKVHRDTVIHLSPRAYSATSSVGFLKHYKKLNGQEMKFADQLATSPTNSRFAWCLLTRETDADENLGTLVEFSYSLDYYYKE